jgi:dimethylargininase
MAACELTYLEREAIDIARARRQHAAYEACLADLGLHVISLPAEPDYPDAVFVEDPALVLDEVAIILRPGAESRRGEADSLARVLTAHRPLRRLRDPATLDGGDVMRAEKTLYVGLSARSNAAGVQQLAAEVEPFGYSVRPVLVHDCLHLKSAASYIGEGTVLLHRPWVDANAFAGMKMIDVPEPCGANVLAIDRTILVPSAAPRTAELLDGLGWRVRLLDNSELMKAEGALTCCSLIFQASAGIDWTLY